jgi:hypothetical protein
LESGGYSHKKNRKKRSKGRRRRRQSRSKSHSVSKVFEPKHYNGDADARAYHRFVKESSAYVKDNRIKAKRRAFALSYFLDGKAYDFYIQKVSRNEEDWTLEEFYTELFTAVCKKVGTAKFRSKQINLNPRLGVRHFTISKDGGGHDLAQ